MDKLLSLCMIVKDEEMLLRRCLESVKGLADEMIVVDTGSTDETKAIASEYTKHVYDYEWNDDFSAAKNAALNKASGQWILVLDADEYVQPDDKEKLRAFLSSPFSRKQDGFLLPILNFMGTREQDKNRVMESSAARLFLNSPNILFMRPIHEQLTKRNGTLKLSNYPFTIFHTGYTDEIRELKDKSRRNLKIFEKLQQGSQLEPYDWFTLANEYQAVKDYEKALYYYERAYARAKPNDSWYPYCLDRMIQTLFNLEHLKEASELIDKGLRTWPNLSDYYCLKGFLLDHFGFEELAIRQFEQSIQIADEAEKGGKKFWLVIADYGRGMAYRKLYAIYEHQLNLPKTVYYLTKMLQDNPGDVAVLQKLASLFALNEKKEDIVSFFSKLNPQDQPQHASVLFQIFTLLGHQELAEHYKHLCVSLSVSHNTAELLRYHLLRRDRNSFNTCMSNMKENEANEGINLSLSMAAVIWRDTSYLHHLSDFEGDDWRDLKEHLLQLPNMRDSRGNGTTATPDHIEKLLIELHRYGYLDEYNLLIEELTDPNVFHRLADHFYSNHQMDLAINYYAQLLQDHSLKASGYLHLARLQFQKEFVEEGVILLRNAIETDPNILSPYGLLFTYCDDNQVISHYKSQFADYFPQHKTLPFIP